MYLTDLPGPLSWKDGEGKDGCPCHTGQPRAEQSVGLPNLPERALHCGYHALFGGDLGAVASAANSTNILCHGALQPGFSVSCPYWLLYYLPEKSQAKDLAIPFATQGSGMEWRISPAPPLHL